MAHHINDRVKESTSTTGTGSFTLTGAPTGFVTFASSLTANGDTTWYCATQGADWEVGLGTRTSATVLARTTILASSNSGAAVSFSSAPTVFSTFPAKRIYGPAFSVYQSTGQSLSATTFTKLSMPNKEFDTDAAFDSTTNNRFQPTVPGYYQLSGAVGFPAPGVTTNYTLSIYKNGAEIRRALQGTSQIYAISVSALVYMNGSTDYAELFAYVNAAATTDGKSYNCNFQGTYIRPPA